MLNLILLLLLHLLVIPLLVTMCGGEKKKRKAEPAAAETKLEKATINKSKVEIATRPQYKETSVRESADDYIPERGERLTEKLSSAYCDFALSIFRASSGLHTNFVISPFSIGAALALVHDGAKGQTQEELTRLLGKTLSPSEVSSLYSSLMADLSQKNKSVTMSVANRFFLDKGFSLKSEYQSRVEKKYCSGAEIIDFKNGESAAMRVNSFVSEKTGGMIDNLVGSGSFSDDAVSMLINAVYFKGSWETPFDEELTKDKKFHGISGDRVVPFMCQSSLITRFSVTESLTVVSLPYKDPSYSLVVLMPKGDFGEWKEKLTAASLQMAINSYTRGTINLELPKFKIESTTDGTATLKQCGVSRMFSREAADLSGIRDDLYNLYVSAIYHKAMIEVSEEGTKAAAATYFAVEEEKGYNVDPVPLLIFDRPFIYALRRDEHILFIGQLC